MEIIIKGSPKELAELLAGLRTEQTAEVKKSAPQKAAEQACVDTIAFEKTIVHFADWINNRPVQNGKIHHYKNVSLSEFANGELFSK